MKRIIRNRKDDSSWRTQGCVRHYLSSLSRITNKTCLLHPSVCCFGLHMVVEITTRILTQHSGLPHCTPIVTLLLLERKENKGGGGQEGQWLLFPFSWAVRGLVTAFSPSYSAPPSFEETSPLWKSEFLWNVSQSECRLKGVCYWKACLGSDTLISQWKTSNTRYTLQYMQCFLNGFGWLYNQAVNKEYVFWFYWIWLFEIGYLKLQNCKNFDFSNRFSRLSPRLSLVSQTDSLVLTRTVGEPLLLCWDARTNNAMLKTSMLSQCLHSEEFNLWMAYLQQIKLGKNESILKC